MFFNPARLCDQGSVFWAHLIRVLCISNCMFAFAPVVPEQKLRLKDVVVVVVVAGVCRGGRQQTAGSFLNICHCRILLN